MDKYEKALEQARNYYPDNQFLDTIFPELAESEDERIRKEIIEYLWDISNQTSLVKESLDCRRWIAYLEKQKEQKPVACENDFVSKPKTSLEILKHYLIWAENSEEDCPYTWKELAAAIKDAIAALEQKPAEWSDKDKNAVNNLVAICTAAKTYRHFAGCRPEEITELQNWLKDLEQMK